MLPSIHFIGPISLIINFLALVYLFRVIFELKGGLKIPRPSGSIGIFISLGITSGFLIIIIIVFSDFNILLLSPESIHTISEFLLMISSVLTLFGAYKLYTIIKYLPEHFLNIIDQTKKKEY